MSEVRTRPGGSAELAGRGVARIGFGTMQLHGPGREAPAAEVAEALLREAVESGANHLDTAEFYGGGEVNRLVRAALAPYPEDLVLATKVGAAERPDGRLAPAQKPAEIRAGVEANLRSLGVEALDVVYLRRVDAPPGIVATGDQIVDLDSQLDELVALREAGKLRGIGLSNVDAAQLERALPAGVVAVQNSYGLLDREAEPLLDRCREGGVAWVPFFPLGSSFEGGRRVVDDPAVKEIAWSLDATPAQVGLAWLLAHAPDILLIPGTASAAHLRENLAAGCLALGGGDVARLDALG